MNDPRLEPRDIATLFDRSRLRLARELRGVSQVELARNAGSVTAGSISQFENGHSRPSSNTLRRLAVALRVPQEFFITPTRLPAGENLGVFFRSLRSTSPRDRQQALAYVQLAREITLELEKYVALPDLNIPRVDIRHHSLATDIEEVAAEVRRHWAVPAGPVNDVVHLLEKNGIIVIRFRVSTEKVDAFCVDFPDRPVVALGADKGLRDRSRFDASHELGHLVMHSADQVGEKIVETQAHQFAAAFLMPARDIRDELPASLDWPKFLSLKAKWHTSISSLVVRARTLDVMDQATYSQAWKTLSAKGWRKIEPGSLGHPEAPILLRRAIDVLSDTGFSFSDFVNRSGLPDLDVAKLLDQDVPERPKVEF